MQNLSKKHRKLEINRWKITETALWTKKTSEWMKINSKGTKGRRNRAKDQQRAAKGRHKEPKRNQSDPKGESTSETPRFAAYETIESQKTLGNRSEEYEFRGPAKRLNGNNQ